MVETEKGLGIVGNIIIRVKWKWESLGINKCNWQVEVANYSNKSTASLLGIVYHCLIPTLWWPTHATVRSRTVSISLSLDLHSWLLSFIPFALIFVTFSFSHEPNPPIIYFFNFFIVVTEIYWLVEMCTKQWERERFDWALSSWAKFDTYHLVRPEWAPFRWRFILMVWEIVMFRT